MKIQLRISYKLQEGHHDRSISGVTFHLWSHVCDVMRRKDIDTCIDPKLRTQVYAQPARHTPPAPPGHPRSAQPCWHTRVPSGGSSSSSPQSSLSGPFSTPTSPASSLPCQRRRLPCLHRSHTAVLPTTPCASPSESDQGPKAEVLSKKQRKCWNNRRFQRAVHP